MSRCRLRRQLRATVTGDAEGGWTVTPSAMSGTVEVSIPDGVDAEKVTVEVAPTKPGLTYTFSEGTTLEGMTQTATKVGDGEKWTPEITVKGGASGFHSIGVSK